MTTIIIEYNVEICGGYIFNIISKIGKKLPVNMVRIQRFTVETTVSIKYLFESGFKKAYSLENGLQNRVINVC